MDNLESTSGAALGEDALARIAGGQTSAGPAETDLWIFREGHKETCGRSIFRELALGLSRLTTNPAEVTDTLIQSGQLESSLADANHPGEKSAARLTDALALALCTGTVNQENLQALASTITTPERLLTSPPEGFTYYALHPLDFGRLVSRIPAVPKACAVIGIRSIGTTLSAVTAAALRTQARSTSRMTVRPTGHPYSRMMDFSCEQIAWIREQISAAAQFLIVDEGPGRSGSTFLAVAESLVRAGVPRELITILGSREVDPSSLLAQQAASRWNAFRFIATCPSVNSRFERCRYLGGGEWRKSLLSDIQGFTEQNWPESWTQMERLKFLSEDGRTLFKFEGMGPFGAMVRERAFILADAGFSPRAADAGDGFLAYSMANGRTLRQTDLSASVLNRMAEYCAFRVANFSAQPDRPDELEQMVNYNVQQEFGIELALKQGSLLARDPILSDGRMQSFEWISGEQPLKTDAIDHGDNHFFPGPCDVAWDLAGITIEWRLTRDAIAQLLARFRTLSGIDASERLRTHAFAYTMFRLGFCKMAISASTGGDLTRLRSAYQRYRALAQQLLAHHMTQPTMQHSLGLLAA